jgi:hypothetical protein
MQNVSTAWNKASRETLLPEMLVELTYQVTDPGIHEEAAVSGVNANSNSRIEELLVDPSDTETRYGTLGWNTWGLDGSFNYYESSYREESFLGGYYSQFSDTTWADGYSPEIVLTFPEIRDGVLPGMRITWSRAFNEWAESFRITTYRGDSRVATTTITGNTSVVSEVEFAMSGYNKIVITILRWSLPHGMARCSEIHLGATSVFLKDDLLGYTHTQTADLLSATLPNNTITFRLRNEQGQWNPDNPQGRGQFLLNQQEVRVRYGMNLPSGTEWIDGGVFWLSEWSVPSNGLEASFTARDILTFMNQTYTGKTSGTLYEIAESALIQADLPGLTTGAASYVIDPVLKEYSGSFESTLNISEVLQLAAHAGNCVIYQDRHGTLRVEPWSPQYTGYVIDQRISYSHPEYEISKPIKMVSVGYGNDLRAEIHHSSRGETQTVDNELIGTLSDATRVGEKAVEVLKNRKVISGEFRADLRLDCLDSIIVTSKYASNIIALTDVEYDTTGGAFRGKYTGRVVSVNLETSPYHVGELFAGEV